MNPHDPLFLDELSTLRSQGLQRALPAFDAASTVNLSSNDYLGLSRHSAVVAAAQAAVGAYGAGGTSSRLLAGTAELHRRLERELAGFFSTERALVFSSGYHVNTGLIPALAGPSDSIFVDKLAHASIIDGIRLSGARFHRYRHNDARDLDALLRKHRRGRRRALIISESVFSMDGDVAPVKELAALARRWDALFYLDEAHAVGLLGRDGRGVAEDGGVLGEVEIFVGTLSKTFGSQGGYVACSAALADLLVSRCRSFIYTTALAPSCVAASLEALRLFPSMSERRARVLSAAASLRAGLAALGYECLSSATQIVPVWSGDVGSTQKISDHLLSHGFFVPSIRPPTVPVGEGRLRVSVTFDAAENGVARLLSAFESYGERPRKRGDKIVQAG